MTEPSLGHDLTPGVEIWAAQPAATAPALARYRTAMNAVHRVARIVAAAGLIGELVFVIADVLCRALFTFSLQCSNELSEVALSMVAFIGGAAAYRESHHMAISIVRDAFPPTSRKIIGTVGEWLVLCASAIACYASSDVLALQWDNVMPTLQISSAWVALHGACRTLRH